MRDPLYWKAKLKTFLHDPPCKCFDIAEHWLRALDFMRSAGVLEDEEDFLKPESGQPDAEQQADWTASAADRFPFPGSSSGLRSKFKGDDKSPFKHPLGGEPLTFDSPLATADLAEEKFQASIGGVPRDLDWKKKFFLYWRRWPEESALHDRRLAYLPADTRMPDHSIWCHMSLTSAFQSCVDAEGHLRPAFLVFQLGPVQDFIAQARSCRDMRSGSYLLSWLTAAAIKTVCDELGPDHLIFPSIRGLGIVDGIFREEMFSQISFKSGGGKSEQTLWERMDIPADRLLTPSIPNRFLALVPAWEAADIAKQAEQAVRDELKNIGVACWGWIESFVKAKLPGEVKDLANWKRRFDRQLDLFPQITWHCQPWTESVELALEQFGKLPGGDARLEQFKNLACALIPEKHRDKRFYSDSGKTQLNNIGFTWAAQYALADFFMAARRNTRDFSAWNTDPNMDGARKDSLSGKEESVGSQTFWEALNQHEPELFKSQSHCYGAMNLVKRLWVSSDKVPYLAKRLGLDNTVFKRALSVESVPGIAENNRDKSNPYVAVIALDGDEMGKWLGGEKTPGFGGQLSAEARDYFDDLKDTKVKAVMETPRALSPAYHLQFSEALANFANYVARPVVEAFGGQLFYAGGDDVLAMLPASKAIECALALRSLFRGETPELLKKFPDAAQDWGRLGQFDISPKGWVTIHEKGKEDRLLLLPGPKAEVSCGIAIAHEDHPLQAIVREARAAERRAKKDYGRSAFAVSLLKRGGETIHWGANWDSGALELLFQYRQGGFSGRFPYALAAVLAPYNLDASKRFTADAEEFDARSAIDAEFELILERQCEIRDKRQREAVKAPLRAAASHYLDGLSKLPKEHLQDFVNLFLAAAFIDRKRGE